MVVNVLQHVRTHVKLIVVLHVVVNVHHVPVVPDVQVDALTHAMKVAMMSAKVVVEEHVSTVVVVAAKAAKAVQVAAVVVKDAITAVWDVLVVMKDVRACA